MNSKAITLAVLVAIIAIGSFVVAQQPTATTKPAADPRLDKIIEQNTEILKNQEIMQKKLDDLKEGLLQVRRRAS